MKEEYKIYQKVVNKKDYFTTWDETDLSRINQILKDSIYNKYKVKCEVFQRDSFTCQNVLCKKTSGLLEMHHVKFKKNGGKDKVNNCITLCITCHKGFHRTKNILTFNDVSYLPVNMRGKTFRVSVNDKVNWKKLKADMKKVRKSLKGKHKNISWKELEALLKWFFEQYENY